MNPQVEQIREALVTNGQVNVEFTRNDGTQGSRVVTNIISDESNKLIVETTTRNATIYKDRIVSVD